MLKLHYFPGNASLIVHLVLEETGVPFALELVDRTKAEHKSPAYLALNPNGLIPVLVDDESRGADGAPLVLFETAAICMHLADVHAAAGLLPPFGTRDRAHAYKWMVWLANTLHPAIGVYFYPDRWTDDAAGVAAVKAKAEAKVGAMLELLDAELARHGGPWLLGTSFSVADPYALVLCRWTRGFGRPARTLPHLRPWLDRMLDRPAVQRAFATEQLAPPLV